MKRVVFGLILFASVCCGGREAMAQGPRYGVSIYSGYGGYPAYRPYPYYGPVYYPPPRVYYPPPYPVYPPPVVGGYYARPSFGFYFGGR